MEVGRAGLPGQPVRSRAQTEDQTTLQEKPDLEPARTQLQNTVATTVEDILKMQKFAITTFDVVRVDLIFSIWNIIKLFSMPYINLYKRIINDCFSARDCTWADWGAWSTCSTTCGNGTRTKTRTKSFTEVGGGICNGLPSESEICNLESCGNFYFLWSIF